MSNTENLRWHVTKVTICSSGLTRALSHFTLEIQGRSAGFRLNLSYGSGAAMTSRVHSRLQRDIDFAKGNISPSMPCSYTHRARHRIQAYPRDRLPGGQRRFGRKQGHLIRTDASLRQGTWSIQRSTWAPSGVAFALALAFQTSTREKRITMVRRKSVRGLPQSFSYQSRAPPGWPGQE